MLPIWRESSQISKAFTTFTAPTVRWAVTRLLKPLEVHPNYQLSWITSIGKPTVRDFISYPSQLDYEFARDNLVARTLPTDLEAIEMGQQLAGSAK